MMLGQLVSTKTSDGIQLHGFLALPRTHCDALWIIVHGVNGNFYSSSLLSLLAETALGWGHAALLINTRGHDLASFGASDTPARLGSMFESIEDAVLDLASWTRFARLEGFSQIGFMAHSLGAVKVGYALSHPSHDFESGAVSRWVALSPPRLNTDLLRNDPGKSQIFVQHLEEAQRWCDEGKNSHMMRVRFPLPNWVSARTFLDKYGSDDKYDYLHWCRAISIPSLWLFGEYEVRQGSANFRDADKLLSQSLAPLQAEGRINGPSETQATLHRIAVLAGADHSYRTTRDELRQQLTDWASPKSDAR